MSDHVAWLRFNDHNGRRPTTIHLCDSDAPGAFKVYRAPDDAERELAEEQSAHRVSCQMFARETIRADKAEAELAELRAEIAGGAHDSANYPDSDYGRGYHKGHHDGRNFGIEAQDAFRRERDAAVEMARGYRKLVREVGCPVEGCDGGTIYRSAPGGWDEPAVEVDGQCQWCALLEELEAKDVPEHAEEPAALATDAIF